MRTHRDRERGSSLTMSLFLVFVLIGVTSSVLSTSLHRYAAVRQEFEQERALQLADMGLDVAFYELQNGVDLEGKGLGVAVGATTDSSFQVGITPAFTGHGQYTLTSVGRFNAMPVALELVVATDHDLDFGVFGSQNVVVSGNFLVDSFDSTLGDYSSQVVGDHAGSEGGLASNGDVAVTGSALVYGDAVPGPGGTYVGDPTFVMGTTAPAESAFTFEPVVYDPPVPSLGSGSGPMVLSSGTHRLTDINLSGSDAITLDGDIKLYVDGPIRLTSSTSIKLTPGSNVTLIHGSGDIDLSGYGIINTSEDAKVLNLLSASTGTIDIRGAAQLYALVYAPAAVVELSGTADVYGSIVGDLVDLSGTAAVHFDEALQVPSEIDLGFRVLSARRLPNPEAVPVPAPVDPSSL